MKQGEKRGLYMPGMFRQEDKDGQIGILRLDKELMISINSEKKTSTEATFKELEAEVKHRRFRFAREDCWISYRTERDDRHPGEDHKDSEGLLSRVGL